MPASRMAMKAVLLFALVSPGQAATVIRSGHAGHWFVPERSGEGWVLEMLSSDQALLYWFTYDEVGQQRWMTAIGEVKPDGEEGERIDFPQLVVTRGARFGATFDPDDVIREIVGEASMRFHTCDEGSFTYSAYGQSQTFEIRRLAGVMGSRCETPHGLAGRRVADHAGQSGSWYDPTHSGEGYALHWATPDQAIITWYSYDASGQQYWMLGVGQVGSDGRIRFPEMHATRGGRFGSGFDPSDVERFAWGELTIELDCHRGIAQYASTIPAFGAGALSLTRLTSLSEVSCPWQVPALTDLYELELAEVPIGGGTPPFAPDPVEVRTITDDGTVLAQRALERGYAPIRFSANTGWIAVGDIVLSSDLHVSADGNRLASSESTEISVAGPPVIWSQATGWQHLSGFAAVSSIVSGVSADFSRMVGRGRTQQQSPQYPWVWTNLGGETRLPLTASIPFGYPTAVSNNGRIVAGNSLRSIAGINRPYAIRWVDQGEPARMLDREGYELGAPMGCNHDCSLIFGSDQSSPSDAHPQSRQAWYWSETEGARYLGSIDQAFLSVIAPYRIGGVTSDGSMVVGTYATSPSTGDVFVWTEHTGLVSLTPLLNAMGIPWPLRSGVDIAPAGGKILLGGETPGWLGSGMLGRNAAVLTLRAKNW